MDSAAPRPADDSPAAPQPAPARNLRRRLFVCGLVLILAGFLWGAFAWLPDRTSSPPDASPAEVSSPFLNTRPGVKYVGTAQCAECHTEVSTYAQHPMGCSVSPAGRWLARQHKAPPSFEASGHRYTIERRGRAVLHREVAPSAGPVAAEVVAEVAFAVGSGRQGQSFLVNRAGALFQSPVSWYTREGAWRLSPGYETKNQSFNRIVPEECLFCHANEARTEPHTLNRYYPPDLRLEPIGCERCHGPGELHVAARERGEVPAGKDLTIVNPRRLEPELREAVCQQCHLQGEARIVRRGRSLYDYRPGLPLQATVSIFVRPPEQADSRRAVSHVEQMYSSRCFQAGVGKLGCISCHDPHVLPPERERVAWYRGRCLNCHREKGCALAPAERRERSPADSCIDCHMPRGDSSNIAHTAVTDHRILRRPDRTARDDKPVDLSLVPFHRDRPGGPGRDRRDLGLALVELLGRPLPERLRHEVAGRACRLLGPEVEKAREDIAALEGLGLALWKDDRRREALDTLEEALKQAPRRELALGTAGLLTIELGEAERSVAYWKRRVAVNPHSMQSHGYLAQALALRQQWPAAVGACRTAVRLNPFEIPTRMLLIDCLVRMGNRVQARAEFDVLLALRPPQPDGLRRWFAELTRPGG